MRRKTKRVGAAVTTSAKGGRVMGRVLLLLGTLVFFACLLSVASVEQQQAARPTSTPQTGEAHALAGQRLEEEAREQYTQATIAEVATVADVQSRADGTTAAMDAAERAGEATHAADMRTSTAEAADATGTAEAEGGTATATAAIATAAQDRQNAENTAVAVQDTRQAVDAIKTLDAAALHSTVNAVGRQDDADQARQPVATWAGYALAGVLVVVILALLWYFSPVLQAKAGTVRRDERGDLPAILTASGGKVNAADLGRSVDPLLTLTPGHEKSHGDPDRDRQERTTARAQMVDAKKGGRYPVGIITKRAWPGQSPTNPQQQQWKPTNLPGAQLPTNVSLAGVLDGPPSFARLALGVARSSNGSLGVVRANMAELVHMLVAGSSGWGKSVFLRAIAYQLAASGEPVGLALADLERATFAPFAKCSKLVYELADNPGAATALFVAITAEMNRRRDLYAKFPGVDNLPAYNARAAQGERVAPWVCIIDEATALLEDEQAQAAVKALLLRGRKYAIGLVVGGQDFKASTVDTTLRNQFSTRVQFRAMSAGQSRIVLDQAGAEKLQCKGRALAILPGRPLVELQAPNITARTITGQLPNGGPQRELPAIAVIAGNGEDDEQDREIMRLLGQGHSLAAICRRVFGYTGGAAFDAVKRVSERA